MERQGTEPPALCIGCGRVPVGTVPYESTRWTGDAVDGSPTPLVAIELCDHCREAALQHRLAFVWCGDCNVWNLRGQVCRGGCGRTLNASSGPV